jgi:hypothetical protein
VSARPIPRFALRPDEAADALGIRRFQFYAEDPSDRGAAGDDDVRTIAGASDEVDSTGHPSRRASFALAHSPAANAATTDAPSPATHHTPPPHEATLHPQPPAPTRAAQPIRAWR